MVEDWEIEKEEGSQHRKVSSMGNLGSFLLWTLENGTEHTSESPH